MLHSTPTLGSGGDLKQYPPLKNLEHDEKNVSPRLRKVCSYTTHLLLQHQQVPKIVKVLELCCNVRNLSVWIPEGDHTELVKALSVLQIESLSVDLDVLCGPSFDHTIFDSLNYVTHLDAINLGGSFWAGRCNFLGRLPQLTCLSVKGLHPEDVIKPILTACKSLELLVVVMSVPYGEPDAGHLDILKQQITAMNESRVVVVDGGPEPLRDWWNTSLTGVGDLWAAGKAVLAGRNSCSSASTPLKM